MQPRIEIVRGDITALAVDAIVNAANESLLGGGGVDGAIHAAAGPELLTECRTLHGCPTGQAKRTSGYNLPAKYVFHTVGPVWRGGDSGEDAQLRSCYRSCFALARETGIASIAFPAISTGVYGFPADRAACIAAGETRDLRDRGELNGLKRVLFVAFDRTAENTLRTVFADLLA